MSNCYSIGQNMLTGYPDGQSQQCIFRLRHCMSIKQFGSRINVMCMHYHSKAFLIQQGCIKLLRRDSRNIDKVKLIFILKLILFF